MITALIFVGTYAVVAAGRAPFLRLDRTGAAIVGAILMVVTRAIGFDDAVRSIDFRTIVLLFSMMIIVAHLCLAGGLAACARFISTHVAHPAALIVALVCAAGVLSALFVNDTICLVFTPIVVDVAASRRHRPLPYLLALATGSNIGSAATLTGNPQNMLIGSVSGHFLRQISGRHWSCRFHRIDRRCDAIWLMFRRQLRVTSTVPAPSRTIRPHRPLLIKTLIVTAAVLTGFLFGYDTALVAAAGAATRSAARLAGTGHVEYPRRKPDDSWLHCQLDRCRRSTPTWTRYWLLGIRESRRTVELDDDRIWRMVAFLSLTF